ncbi:BAG family molecular chaperone regulator 5, mitochondrial [Spinacia oleracea]|uniref:BAG family molecular chaperone regulator 5, mitochondrial n=1 Tax=Spinacia oleracea TaxID=3562 RepID=A0ABM3QKI8_SPIOL|nr:BAG family molecular chaperone regulator 5, mitochondrial [Spinacia oleracea]
MKPNRKARFSPSSSSTSTVTYTYRNDNSTLPKTTTTEIPITVHFHDHSAAASKIQTAYRSYVVRSLLKKIAAIEKEVDKLERLIQQQETVDAVRSSEKDKLRINEALMVQLLKLDSVPGFNLSVKELRKSLSRRIVGLQEVMDGICGDHRLMDGWDLWRDWDEGFGGIEEKFCRERGGEELEKFCAYNLGFRCLERFLRQ